jgi:hypothetical protein
MYNTCITPSLPVSRAAFDNVGRLVMDDELNKMLSEVGGPCNYDNMIKVGLLFPRQTN